MLESRTRYPKKPFEVEIINKELVVERKVTARYLAGVLFHPDVRGAWQQLETKRDPFLDLVRDSGWADDKSDDWARKYGFAERNFVVYGSVANPEYIEVAPVVTGGLKRAGSGKGVELLPNNMETAFSLFEFHSEPVMPSQELVIPSAYSHGEPGDLWVVFQMRAFLCR